MFCIFCIIYVLLKINFRFLYCDSGYKLIDYNNNELQQSRWALICVLCRERVGACIQCSIKTCKTAYHVTCAFKYGLEMKAIIEDEMADDGVKLRVSYCMRSKFIEIIVSRRTIDQSDNFVFLVVLSKA